MQTSNTEEMVTISRAEYERLQQENAQLEAKSAKLEETHVRLEAKLAAREQEQAQVITSLTLQNEWLLEQLKLSKKKLFGRSSEQAEQMVMDQLSLTYNELEAYAFGTKAATEKQITVKAHERKRQSGNVLDVVPEGTPTEVVEHRLLEPEYREALKLRQVWCEGSFSAQKREHNLARVLRRGLEAAEDHCLLSATALNLKRMIKYAR